MSERTRTPEGTARDPRRPWAPGPFTRLARTHAFSVAGDTAFTVAMAGTVFFSVNDLDEARSRVALTLIFTIAPFAVAAPLIGPALDGMRGGRRGMIIVINLLRVVVAVLLSRHYSSWLLYLEGLLMLVLSKGYLIARGALVPTVVRSDEELVRANARLTLLSGITGAVMVLPAGLLLQIGPSWSLGFSALLFVGATVMAFQLPRTTVAATPLDAQEKAELRSAGITLAASSMGLLRGIVGFLSFLLAFHAKDHDLPILLVVAAVTAQGGFLLASVTSPRLREATSEERILVFALVGVALVAAPMGLLLLTDEGTVPVVFGAALVSMVVGYGSNVGKQAFDAIVQRDAPDANRGRSFARFETRFQLVWVVGALLPVALGIPLPVAFLLIAGVAAFAAASYVIGRRRAAGGLDPRIVRVDRGRLLARVRPGRGAAAAGEVGPGPAGEDLAVDAVAQAEARRRRTLGDQTPLARTRRRGAHPSSGGATATSEAPTDGGDVGDEDDEDDATLLLRIAEPAPSGLFDGTVPDQPRSRVDPTRPFEATGVPLAEARPRWRTDPAEDPSGPAPRDRGGATEVLEADPARSDVADPARSDGSDAPGPGDEPTRVEEAVQGELFDLDSIAWAEPDEADGTEDPGEPDD